MKIPTVITRQIVLDIETTGMNMSKAPYEGHCIIEIGAVEIIDRRLTGNNFHVYLKPNRLVDPTAFSIHGISDEFLLDKPTFHEIANEFLEYIYDTELIIHNASFDIGFINYELNKLKSDIGKTEDFCQIIDSLSIARKLFPGKRNSLDALCSRYEIDKSKRTLHGALLDAEILAEIFLAMTGGQISLSFLSDKEKRHRKFYKNIQNISNNINTRLRVITASDEEIVEHKRYLDLIMQTSGHCLWNNN